MTFNAKPMVSGLTCGIDRYGTFVNGRFNRTVLEVSCGRLQIPRSALIPLTTRDKEKAQELLRRPYMSSQATWKHEVNIPSSSSCQGLGSLRVL